MQQDNFAADNRQPSGAADAIGRGMTCNLSAIPCPAAARCEDDPDDTYWYQEDGWVVLSRGVPQTPDSPVSIRPIPSPPWRSYRAGGLQRHEVWQYAHYGNRLMLSVYGPGWLSHAALVENSVLSQNGGEVTANPVCQDEPRPYQEYYYPQPGLSWS